MHYARIHALAAYKSDNFADIDAATDIVKHIVRESRLHIEVSQFPKCPPSRPTLMWLL